MFEFFKRFTKKSKNNIDDVKSYNKVSSIQKICPCFNHPIMFIRNPNCNDFVCDFSIYSASIQGTREFQQDDYYLSTVTNTHNKHRIFAVVCDGMGGMTDGDKASRIAVKTIAMAYDKIHTNEIIDYNRFLTEETILCNKLVNNMENGAGTTMTSLIIEDNKLYWCSVGDSRIYIKRDNDLYLITRDHNYYLLLKAMVDKGEITLRNAKDNPQRESLISYIGMDNIEIMDSNNIPYYLKDNDVILLCSDGVTKTLDKNELFQCMYDKDAYSIVENIIENINKKELHSQDNATLIVIKYTQ